MQKDNGRRQKGGYKGSQKSVLDVPLLLRCCSSPLPQSLQLILQGSELAGGLMHGPNMLSTTLAGARWRSPPAVELGMRLHH